MIVPQRALRRLILTGSVLVVAALLRAWSWGGGHAVPAGTPGRTPDVATTRAGERSGPAVRRPDVGFGSTARLIEHFEKHGREFGTISMDEYLRRAQVLRDRPLGGDLQEAVRADSVITRFDPASGAFIAFDRDDVIRTYFRPIDGAAYFRRQLEREH